MKKLFNILLILIITLFFSFFCGERDLPSKLIEIIYTVSGILFSVGMGLVTTFNMGSVKNPIYRSEIKKSITRVRNSFFFYFVFSTSTFILNSIDIYLFFSMELINKYFNFSVFTLVTIIISIFYFVTNFTAIQSLNQEIEDLDLR